MKMNKLVAVLTSFALLATIIVSSPSSNAATTSQIDKQINEANDKIKDAQQKANDAEAEKKNLEEEKSAITAKTEAIKTEIAALNKEIQAKAIEKNKTEVEKAEKENQLYQTEQELEAAEEQVAKSDELLQKRTRLMYSNGVVSYLDVLLSATSFTDFLDRFDALQMILSSDREILEKFKVEQQLVEDKKVQIAEQLEALDILVAKITADQEELSKKEAEKEKLVASYDAKVADLDEHMEDLESVSEDQEALLMQLASQVSKLNAEKKAKLAEQAEQAKKTSSSKSSNSSSSSNSTTYTGGKLGMPIGSGYRVTSNFGMRIHPISGVKKGHTGMDFGAPSGTSIYAAESGTVIVSKYWSGYGNCIIIDHGNGLWTLYGHIKDGGRLVSEGDNVSKGDKIALVGSTGNSTGPHLHFEVRENEVPVNPASYLK